MTPSSPTQLWIAFSPTYAPAPYVFQRALAHDRPPLELERFWPSALRALFLVFDFFCFDFLLFFAFGFFFGFNFAFASFIGAAKLPTPSNVTLDGVANIGGADGMP